MRRTSFLPLFIVVLLVILVAPAGGAAPAAPLAPLASVAPTVVSYQGQVKVGGTTYDGTGYFKFAVVNQAGNVTYWTNNGTSSGEDGQPTAAVPLTVTNGLFSVLLGDTALTNMTQPLTSAAFTGAERYLRVWFSTDAGGPFTLLSPDRHIAAVPYALRVEKEGNLITVATSGGDFTSVQAALDSIGTAATDTNPYLIRVGPGVYDGQVTMKPYVDIEGSGELVTKLTRMTDIGAEFGTLVGADNAEARFLTIEAKGADGQITAVKNLTASPRLTHVTLVAEGIGGRPGDWGSVVALSNASAAPILTDVTIRADVKGYHYDSTGIQNSSSAPVMTRVNVTVAGGTRNNTGVQSNGTLSSVSPMLTNVTVTATGGDLTTNIGVQNSSNAPPMLDVTATATGGSSSTNTGVQNSYSGSTPVLMTNVAATASGGTGSTNSGVDNAGGSLADMRQVVARASGGTTTFGVHNRCSGRETAGITMTLVTASGAGATGTESANYGVYSSNGDSGSCGILLQPTLTDVTATANGGESAIAVLYYYGLPSTMTGLIANASGGSLNNTGASIFYTTVTIQNSAISANGTPAWGVRVSGTGTVKINNSQISGSTNTILVYRTSNGGGGWMGGTAKVGASQLDGGPVLVESDPNSSAVCIGVYNGSYISLDSTCQ